jgi:hypothetical protein
MNMKDHILAALREQFHRWQDTLTSLSMEQVTTPLIPSQWSIKDNIAHLWAWQQRSIARLEAGLLNREPEFPTWPADLDPDLEDDIDGINNWIYQTGREISWKDVNRNWKQGFVRFLELGEKLPEKDLLDSGKYSWMKGYPLVFTLLGSYDHHREHLEELVAWLQEHGKK